MGAKHAFPKMQTLSPGRTYIDVHLATILDFWQHCFFERNLPNPNPLVDLSPQKNFQAKTGTDATLLVHMPSQKFVWGHKKCMSGKVLETHTRFMQV
jgi:hypothetical protein